jgi:pimeloyl-ACP methyl ester carboxylesterase
MSDAAILPPRGSPLGLASGLREAGAFWASLLRPPPFPADVPRGDGHSVLVIPGFLAGNWTTARLRAFLRHAGYRVQTANIAFNAGPTPRMLARLDATLLRLSSNGARVSIVGQSLGGILARSLAMRHTERVRCVVTLCSPIRFPVATPLQPFAAMLARFQDADWLADRNHVTRAPGVPVTAIYTQEDGILDWRQCLQDETAERRNVRVGGAHSTAGSNPDVQRVTAIALAQS